MTDQTDRQNQGQGEGMARRATEATETQTPEKPSQAEGDRETVEESIQEKGAEGDS